MKMSVIVLLDMHNKSYWTYVQYKQSVDTFIKNVLLISFIKTNCKPDVFQFLLKAVVN